MANTPPLSDLTPRDPASPTTLDRARVSVEPVPSALISLSLLSLADTLPGLNRWVAATAAVLTPEQRRTNRLVFAGLRDALGIESLPPGVLPPGVLPPGVLPRGDHPASFADYLAALAAADPAALRARALERFRARFARAQSAQSSFGADPSTPPDARRLLEDVDAYLTCVRLAGGPDASDRALHTEAHALLRDPAALRHRLADHFTMLWEAHLAAEWRRIQPKLDWQAQMFAHALTTQALATQALATQALPADTPSGAASPANAFHWLTGRDLPAAALTALTALTGIPQVILVPTWHLGRQVIVAVEDPVTSAGHATDDHRAAPADARDHGAVARIYFSEPPNYDVTVMRAAAVGRAELRARLAALADETRLRILALCANRDELTAQEIIADLDLSQSNVSRHLKQLVEAGFLHERRGAGANKTYRLSAFYFDRVAGAVERLALPAEIAATAPVDERDAATPELRRFLDTAGRVTTWPPAKQRDKLLILDYLAGHFEAGRAYAEREVNELLGHWSVAGDTAALRRALYEFRFVNRARDGSRYWLSGTLDEDPGVG